MKSIDLIAALGNLPEEYIARELSYEPPNKRTLFITSRSFISTISVAACLFLTIGLVHNVWSKQQRIEPLPPKELMSETGSETRTETTAQSVTESYAETSRKLNESTVKQPELIASDPMTAHTTIMSIATTTVPTTILKMTSVTTDIPTVMSSINAQPSSTRFVTETSSTVASAVQMECDICTSEKKSAEAYPSSTEQTGIQTETTEKSSDKLPQIEGFQITWDELETNKWRITYLDTVSPSPENFCLYASMSEEYQAIPESVTNDSMVSQYRIKCKDSAKFFWLNQYERNTFNFLCEPYCLLESGTINGNPCVWLFSYDAYTLYWDDGYYTFCIFGETADREKLAKIAESFVRKEE